MTEPNPYEASPTSPPPAVEPVPGGTPRRVPIQPFALLQRGLQLMGDQYLLMVGVGFVAILLGSLVPFGLLYGPMFVGMYLCFLQRERYGLTEFGTLFKGFDFFVDALVVLLLTLALSLVVLIPGYLVMFALFFAMVATAGPEPEGAAVLVFAVSLIFLIFVLTVLSLVVYMPFLFAFQLIADRRVKALDAVKLSWAGVKKNGLGLLGHMLVLGIGGMLSSLLCYIPVFFFFPISFASLFVVYRDIYGPESAGPPALSSMVPSPSPVPGAGA